MSIQSPNSTASFPYPSSLSRYISSASPLALDRFPPEIQSMILGHIELLDKSQVAKMMLTSKDMLDHYGKFLYRSITFTKENVANIFYGIIFPVPDGSIRRDSYIPLETDMGFNFAIASPVQIASHTRKIQLLQHTSLVVLNNLDDENSLCSLLQRLPLSSPFIDDSGPGCRKSSFSHVDLIIRKYGNGEIAERLLAPEGRLSTLDTWILQSVFNLKNICVTLPEVHSIHDNRASSPEFLWHLACLVMTASTEADHFIHNAWWDPRPFTRCQNLHLDFMDCTCSPLCRSGSHLKKGGQPVSPFCPFTADDLVEHLIGECKKGGRHTPAPRITFHNVPKCTANTPWSTVERKFRDGVDGTAPGYKVEKMVKMWKPIFESFKEENKANFCRLCGGDS